MVDSWDKYFDDRQINFVNVTCEYQLWISIRNRSLNHAATVEYIWMNLGMSMSWNDGAGEGNYIM